MGEVCRGGLERDGVARAISDSTSKTAGPESERGKAELIKQAAVLADLVSLCSLKDVPVKDVPVGRCEARQTIGVAFSVFSTKSMDTVQSIVPSKPSRALELKASRR